MRNKSAKSKAFTPECMRIIRKEAETICDGVLFKNELHRERTRNAAENLQIIKTFFLTTGRLPHDRVLSEPSSVKTSNYFEITLEYEDDLRIIPEADEYFLEALKEADYLIFETGFDPEAVIAMECDPDDPDDYQPGRLEYIDGMWMDEELTEGGKIFLTAGYYVGSEDSPEPLNPYRRKHNYKAEYTAYLNENGGIEGLRNKSEKNNVTTSRSYGNYITSSGIAAEEIDQLLEEHEYDRSPSRVALISPIEVKKVEDSKRDIAKILKCDRMEYRDGWLKTDLSFGGVFKGGIVLQPECIKLMEAIQSMSEIDIGTSEYPNHIRIYSTKDAGQYLN